MAPCFDLFVMKNALLTSWTRFVALGTLWLALGSAVDCDPAANSDTTCAVTWECGVDTFVVSCDTVETEQPACVCERNMEQTGLCDRAEICHDARAYADAEPAAQQSLVPTLRGHTIACCGYSVSTDNGRCSLSAQ